MNGTLDNVGERISQVVSEPEPVQDQAGTTEKDMVDELKASKVIKDIERIVEYKNVLDWHKIVLIRETIDNWRLK